MLDVTNAHKNRQADHPAAGARISEASPLTAVESDILFSNSMGHNGRSAAERYRACFASWRRGSDIQHRKAGEQVDHRVSNVRISEASLLTAVVLRYISFPSSLRHKGRSVVEW